MKPAVFLDRDGTLIQDVHHLVDPAQVRLIPGAGEALCLLRSIGFACVLVTNQSVVGRGLISVERLDEIHIELTRQLNQHRADLDGLYYSTSVPVSGDRRIVDDLDRKPGPGMLLRAARDLDLDLDRSWMIGDMISDMLAGRAAGCRTTILVRTGGGARVDRTDHAIDHVCDDILEAAQFISRSRSVKNGKKRTEPEVQKGRACLPTSIPAPF